MFWFSKDIPKLTFKDKPIKEEWLLDYGFIDQILIIIPPGANGLTGIRLFQGTSQIEPRNSGDYFFGDNLFLKIPVAIEMYDRPYTITAELYNEDDIYNHKIIVGFSFHKGKVSKPVKTFAELMRFSI